MKVHFVFVLGQLNILPSLILSLSAYDEDLGMDVEDCSLMIGWLFFHVVIRFKEE